MAVVVPITVDARQVSRIARGIRRAAPEAWKAARIELLAVGEDVAKDARVNASYSTRIPGAIKAQVTASGNVRIKVTGDPGVPIENNGKGFIRHPVFNRNVWTSKNSHPAFLLPAFATRREEALARIERVYLDAFEIAFETGV